MTAAGWFWFLYFAALIVATVGWFWFVFFAAHVAVLFLFHLMMKIPRQQPAAFPGGVI